MAQNVKGCTYHRFFAPWCRLISFVCLFVCLFTVGIGEKMLVVSCGKKKCVWENVKCLLPPTQLLYLRIRQRYSLLFSPIRQNNLFDCKMAKIAFDTKISQKTAQIVQRSSLCLTLGGHWASWCQNLILFMK